MKKLKNKKIVIVGAIILILLILGLGVFLFIISTPDIESIKDSVVMVETFDEDGNLVGTGSGFCVYNGNYIATNFHVIAGAKKIKIITDDNREYLINKILIFSPDDDLALLSGEFSLNPLEMGDISGIKAGDKVIAIGSPKGQLNTVSNGIISNADNEYEIRITAPISPGSSGGALFNGKGKIIGVTYAVFNSIDAQNINYAISVKYLNELYNSYNNKKYKEVNEENYKNYAPNITNFSYVFGTGSYYEYHNSRAKDDIIKPISFNTEGDKYFFTSDLSIFYKATNKRNLFDNAINNMGQYSLKEEYNQMTDAEKEEVINNYEYLRSLDSYSNTLPNNVSEWSKEQFIMKFKLMQCQELAIFSVQCGKEEPIDIINRRRMG